MKANVECWTIGELIEKKSRIHLKPKFQRGPAWSDRQQSLLINSIVNGFDLPKFYFNHLANKKGVVHSYDYEVVDGQQRLRAILEFCKDKIPLTMSSKNGEQDGECQSYVFSTLPDDIRTHFEEFELTVSVIENASTHELQSLFARLQMGVALNPPELRNALCSVIGSVIEMAAVTHPLFVDCKIPDKRYLRQDYLSHALALATYNNAEDLKAPLLKKLYEDGLTQYDENLVQQAFDVLDWMNELSAGAKKILSKKWAFVDVFDFLSRNYSKIKGPKKKAILTNFSEKFEWFETERLRANKEPELLLTQKPIRKQLYNYVVAFKTTPAAKEQISKRRRAFNHYFRKVVKQ